LWTSLYFHAYNSITLMLPLQPVKSGLSLLLIAFVILAALATACASPVPSPVPTDNDAQPPTGAIQAPVAEPEPVKPVPSTLPDTGSPVQIKLIHYRGTLSRIGCCVAGFYERDEFVVIQNISETYQDIAGWRLTNITRGYPTFIFPLQFPCIPYNLPTLEEDEEQAIADSYYTITGNPAQSEVFRFSTNPQQTKPANVPSSDVDWSSCTPLEPLDQTPMKPAAGQEGIPVPCVLYPGQTVLVFTDEVHCQTGGFSFNWGLGNIWNNEIADTAVLYNADGQEVSRRSYLTGR